MRRQILILVRMSAHFLVLSVIVISLLMYWPGSRLLVPAAQAGELVSGGFVTSEVVTLGELTRRIERVEGIELEHRLSQLEARVEALSTLLWSGLFGLAALVLEMFGRMGVSLVAKARHQPR